MSLKSQKLTLISIEPHPHIYILGFSHIKYIILQMWVPTVCQAGGSEVKAFAWNVGDPSSIPGSGRSPGEGKWQPTPVFLLGEFHGHRSLGATVHGVSES